jgi:hypothetical protein
MRISIILIWTKHPIFPLRMNGISLLIGAIVSGYKRRHMLHFVDNPLTIAMVLAGGVWLLEADSHVEDP